MLSERIEAIELGRAEEKFTAARMIRSLILGVSDLVWSISFLLVVNVPIFLLGLVTGVGAPIAAVLNFAFTALVLAQEFVTLPLTRRLVGYRRRFGVIWANKWLAFGFGVAAMGMLLIPGLNLVLLPLAAVGGTLAFCDLEASDRVGPAGNDLQAAA
jgi:CysZ protein